MENFYMTKARLDQLRDKMNECSNQIQTQKTEESRLIVQVKNHLQAYDNLVLQIAQQESQMKIKTLELITVAKSVSDTTYQANAERGLIEKMKQYLSEYDQSHQAMANIALLGVEGNDQLLGMINNVNDAI